MRAKPLTTFFLRLLPVLTLVACGPSEPPVATLEVEPTDLQLAFPGVVDLNLSWSIERPLDGLEGTPLVFVHLVDEQGDVRRTFDHPLDFEWSPGQSREYGIHLYQSALAPPLQSGTYSLTAGLYDSTGRRWPLRVEGRETGQMEYRVAEVDVRGEAKGSPMFFFSPAWLPLESGLDAQIMARRWLGESEGTIRVVDCPDSGSLWMLIRIPSAKQEEMEMVLAEEASAPEVRVTSTCGLEEICVSGPGFHVIEVSLATAKKELLEACELRLKPNFRFDSEPFGTPRSLALEVIAWAE